MKLQYFALLLGIPTALATGSKAITANFDDLNAIPGAPALLTPVPSPYKDLNYTGFNAAAPLLVNNPAANLLPSSGAAFASSQSATPSLSINYPGSKIKSFNFRAANAGCYASLRNGAAAPPLDCTLLFKGQRAHGRAVNVRVKFSSGGSLALGLGSKKVDRFVFNHLEGLRSLSISIVDSSLGGLGLDGAVARFAVDDLSYVLGG